MQGSCGTWVWGARLRLTSFWEGPQGLGEGGEGFWKGWVLSGLGTGGEDGLAAQARF